MNSKNKNQYYLKDAEWQLVANLAVLPSRGRRKKVDPRAALSACLCVLESGLTWKAASEMFGISSTTIRSYYKKLRQNRKWNQIHSILEIYRETKGRLTFRVMRIFRRFIACALVVFMFALPAYPVFASEARGEAEQQPAGGNAEQPVAEKINSEVALLAEQKNSTAQESAETQNDTPVIADADADEIKSDSQLGEPEASSVAGSKTKSKAVQETNAVEQTETDGGQLDPVGGEVGPKTDSGAGVSGTDKTIESSSSEDNKKPEDYQAGDDSQKAEAEDANTIDQSSSQKESLTEETNESLTMEKPKTVYALKEVKKKTTEETKEIENIKKPAEATNPVDKAVVAGVSTQAKGEASQENTADKDNKPVASEDKSVKATRTDEAAAEVPQVKQTSEDDAVDVLETGSQKIQEEKPVDIDALKEELRREVMAEVMEGCLEFEDGSYYCAEEAAKVDEDDYMEKWLSLFSVKKESDLDSDEEIYFEKDGKQVRLTDRKTRDMFLAQDIAGRSAVWQSLVNGRWQVFYYDKDSEEPRQLTSGNYNNMNPQIYDNTVVWQAWVDGDWDIFMAEKQMVKLPNSANQADSGEAAMSEGWVLRQITDNDLPDMFPKIAAGVVTWQGFRSGAWQVFAFDLKSRTVTQISDGQGNYENPRFSIVWDDRQKTGETYTVGYDIASGELQKLGEFGDEDDEPISNDTAQHDEDVIMVTRSEGSQNQQNKDKNENKKTQN